MKSILFIFILATFFSCENSSKKNSQAGPSAAQSNTPKDYTEVLYFHGKQRCVTCNAIEKLTKEVVEKDFAQQVKDGKVTFRIVDISTQEGEKTADQYEVTWSSLFINKWKDGKESRNNMTDFGFSHAKGSPDVFKAGVKEKIDELLK